MSCLEIAHPNENNSYDLLWHLERRRSLSPHLRWSRFRVLFSLGSPEGREFRVKIYLEFLTKRKENITIHRFNGLFDQCLLRCTYDLLFDLDIYKVHVSRLDRQNAYIRFLRKITLRNVLYIFLIVCHC